MNVFLYWSGVFFWLLVAAGCLVFLALLIRDGVDCARYVSRMIVAGGWKDGITLITKVRTVVILWWQFFVGTRWRPDRAQYPDGAIIYWPGCEPQPEPAIEGARE